MIVNSRTEIMKKFLKNRQIKNRNYEEILKESSEAFCCLNRLKCLRCKQDDKPGYVVDGHLSRPAVAGGLKQPT